MRKDLRVIPKHPEPAPQAWSGPAFFINPGDSQTGLWDVARKLWRRKWLVAGGTLAFIAAGVAVTALMTPRYGAESQVLIGIQTPRVLNADSILSGITANAETVQSEAYIVTSHAVAEKVARRLDLDKLPEFNAALRPEPAFDLSRMLGIDAIKSWLSKPPKQPAPEDAALTAEQRKWDSVVATLLSGVDVTPLNRSHVLSIDTQSEDPQLAARIANTFADVYIEQQLKTKQKATTDADHWLDTRIAQLKQQVQKSDKAVEDYRRKHGLYETKSDTVIAQQLAELNREMLAAQNSRVEAESRYHQAKSQLKTANSMESLPAVLNSPLIQTLRGQQSQLEQKSAQLASIYTAKHPLRRDIAAQIKEIKTKIRAEAQRIVDGLSHQAQMADDRFNRVKQQMAALQAKMGDANEETVKLHQLQREAEANRTMLVALLQRSKETVDQQSLLVPDARVISKADVPLSPSFPPSTLILVLTTFAGLGCSVLLALLLEGIDQTFRAREDVEHETGLPVLALVPSVSKTRQVSADPRAPVLGIPAYAQYPAVAGDRRGRGTEERHVHLGRAPRGQDELEHRLRPAARAGRPARGDPRAGLEAPQPAQGTGPAAARRAGRAPARLRDAGRGGLP